VTIQLGVPRVEVDVAEDILGELLDRLGLLQIESPGLPLKLPGELGTNPLHPQLDGEGLDHRPWLSDRWRGSV
jgi:hypothetical protein